MGQATIPIMSTIDMRGDILKWVDQVDESFLSAVHAMMGTYVAKQEAKTKVEDDPIVSYDVVTGTPRTASELTAILDKEVEAARGGEYITLEALREKSNQWLASIK